VHRLPALLVTGNRGGGHPCPASRGLGRGCSKARGWAERAGYTGEVATHLRDPVGAGIHGSLIPPPASAWRPLRGNSRSAGGRVSRAPRGTPGWCRGAGAGGRIHARGGRWDRRPVAEEIAGRLSREESADGNLGARRASLFRGMIRLDRETRDDRGAAPRWGVGKPPAGTPGGRASPPNEEDEPDTRTDGELHAANGVRHGRGRRRSYPPRVRG
jgi:hypothetical protein